ncbi:MAG: replication initiation protein [Fusobacteriaceae bacterium]
MEIVQYHNDMNKISFGNFKEKEMDLLFSICYKMKNEELSEVTLDFSELKNLSAYSDRHKDRFYKDLDSVYKKLLELNMKIESETELVRFVLFTRYKISKDQKKVSIKINEEFKYLLNNLTQNYTRFELNQFVKLKSRYSKNIFKYLKQFQSTKYFFLSLEEFRELLAIPKSYRMSDIDKQILKPCIAELGEYFPELKLEKEKKGRNVDKLKFSWKAAQVIKIGKQEIVISEKLESTVKKANKNRYLEHILKNVSNIEKLLKDFSEEQLIKGLNKAYIDINYNIKNLTYLKKVIKTANESSEKILVVKQKKESKKIELDKENDNTEFFQVEKIQTLSKTEEKEVLKILVEKGTDITFFRSMKEKNPNMYWNTLKQVIKI